MILSVCLFVRYRNHFPVVRFQNQAHIRNPHDPAEVFKNKGRLRRPLKGAPILSLSFTAAEGAAPPEGEINPAEGRCFAS